MAHHVMQYIALVLNMVLLFGVMAAFNSTLTLPGVAEERYLVVLDKIAATPEKYPRRVGIPAKRPL